MINLLTALGLGVLSFASPCVLPLVPVYLANIAGASVLTPDLADRRHIFFHAISFVVGFSLVYIALGAIFGLFGAVVPQELFEKIAGALLIAFGVFLVAAMKIPWLNYEKRVNLTIVKGSGYLRSLLIGVVFSLGLTPCTSPQLAGVLTMVANSQTAWQRVYPLLGYCLGLGLPFIAVGLAWGSASRYLRWLSRHGFVTTIVAAVLLISVGILMLTGYLDYLSGLLPGGYRYGQ
jgi:cytochrome c-type biogenesis protein